MSRAVITAAEAVCALGGDLEASLEAWRQGRSGLAVEDGLLAGRIACRTPLKGRRYGAASNLAVHVARRAVRRAGWTADQIRDAWIYAASSRGNVAELLGASAWRRPSRRFSASNTLHSEIAAAVSIELGVRGPWHMISNGCSSGLDALGHAWMALRAGMAERVIVVAAELPLLPELLKDFRDTRLLSRDAVNDPLSSQTSGFHPGEAGVAVTLETRGKGCVVEEYRAGSDAYDSLVIPGHGGALAGLLCGMSKPDIICPHATGTPNHAIAEMNALRTAYAGSPPPLLLLKPLTGHTLGASGLLDVAMLAGWLSGQGEFANLPGLHAPPGFELPERFKWRDDRQIVKIASGMGGHVAAVALRASIRT